MIDPATICEMTELPIGGPVPPAHLLANDSLSRSVREGWLRRENPHLWVHEELRLARAAVTRARSPRAPGYQLKIAQERVADAVAAFKAHHRARATVRG